MQDPGITPHPGYLALGHDTDGRQTAYRALIRERLDPTTEEALRAHTQQNKAFGNERFRRQIEALVGRSMEIRPRGRPPAGPGMDLEWSG